MDAVSLLPWGFFLIGFSTYLTMTNGEIESIIQRNMLVCMQNLEAGLHVKMITRDQLLLLELNLIMSIWNFKRRMWNFPRRSQPCDVWSRSSLCRHRNVIVGESWRLWSDQGMLEDTQRDVWITEPPKQTPIIVEGFAIALTMLRLACEWNWGRK